MFELLELSNFRCFKTFSMNLKPITLISGKNNTGKSSILDSLFLFQDYADPDVFLKLLGFRGLRQADLSAKTVWEPLFHNMDISSSIQIHLNGKYSLNLTKNDTFALSVNSPGGLDGRIDYTPANYALSCCFERDSVHFTGDYLLGSRIMNPAFELRSHDHSPIQPNSEFIQYLGPNVTLEDNAVPYLFGQIELSKNNMDKRKLMDVLAILDEEIADITTIASSGFVQLYFTNRQGIKMPIHTMGDGVRKLLHISLILLANPGCILLLDEVENGLHYSLYEKFWEMISTLAVQENCQIIATTHSYECINGALEGVKLANLEDSFAYTRLDRNENGVAPKTFTSDMLERALDSDWEVR